MARRINLKRDRFLFYVGLVLVRVGGSGLTAGSYAHDSLRVPVGGTAFDAFGWLNQTALGVGVVLLLIGIVFLILGLRGGVLSASELADVKAGGSRT